MEQGTSGPNENEKIKPAREMEELSSHAVASFYRIIRTPSAIRYLKQSKRERMKE